jgi:SAM-dependent methyltransferase
MASDREIAELKDRSRQAWDGAEYAPLAERLMPVADALVDACAVSAGQEVLDVAAGNGNAAVAAAREGARAVASDFAPQQVERGRARTEAEGYDVEWVVADVEELPFDDASFDCVLSVFGAMFGPRPERVAAELFRVIRPGGTVGMANWGDFGFQAEFFQTLRRYEPPRPEGVPLPSLWGDEAVVRERFDGLAASVTVERRAMLWEFGSFPEMAEFFRRSGPRGPDQMPEDRLRALVADLQAVVERHNQASGGAVRVEAEYSQVVARKRG